MSRWKTVLGCGIAAAVVFLAAVAAHAQISTATIKGRITKGEAPAGAGINVMAANKESGFTYKGATQAGGLYVITGVPPGPYELRISGPEGISKSEIITVAVGQTVTVDLVLTKKEATEEIVVTGTRLRQAVATSEVGANVSIEMVQAMPAPTHNFLAGVDLVPGVAFVQNASNGYTNIQAGAQNKDSVTVFIDGVNQKNNILRGGVAGQDTSRGNPFPQSAVREYKVITQNYKAEYDQVASAAITAVTRSGGNEFHGSAYIDRTETQWRELSTFEKRKQKESGQALPPSSKNEFGLSAGGAIKADVVNYFVAYDGKDISDSRQVLAKNLSSLPADKGLVPMLAQQGGAFVDPFIEHLVFAKVNAAYADDRRLTAEFRTRLESDTVAENSDLSAKGNDKDRANNEYRVDLLHEMSFGSDWLLETRAGYQYSVWNPKSNSKSPMVKYKVSTAKLGDPEKLGASSDVIFMGGSPDYQKKSQGGFGLSQDFTFTGLLDNIFKAGAKVNFLKYDLSGTKRYVDVVETLVDRASGMAAYNGATCDGSNIAPDGLSSDQCKIETALPSTSASMSNTQIGLFLQDDLTLFDKLELNLGVRWDVETNMLNNSYKTPQDRVDALKGPDTRGVINGIPQPSNQTYAQSLENGGIKIDDYISTGKSRKVFFGAVAPRVGLSFDVFGDKGTVFYGGFGRSYDRAIADNAIAEKVNNAVAMTSAVKPDIFLIKNKFNMPYANQWGVGVRQGVFDWNAELGFSWLDGYNQFQWFSGNRDYNGGFGGSVAYDPLFGGPYRYNNLVLGDFVGRTRTKAVMAKLEKPYTKASGWTVAVAYTYSDAQTQHRDWNDDAFDWTFGKSTHTWHRSVLIEKHRLVAAGMYDVLPWDLRLSSKATFASGMPRRVYFSSGKEVEDYSPAFLQVDLGLVKIFKTTLGDFSVRADVLNLFDRSNYFKGNQGAGDVVTDGTPGNSFGGSATNTDQYTGLRGPRRTVKVAMALDF